MSKLIRTTWAQPVYTIEITEEERERIALLLGAHPVDHLYPLYEFFKHTLPASKP